MRERRTIRNIAIFIFVTLASGWLGLVLDRILEPQAEGESLGMGLWLILPLLTTLCLRGFAGDGWRDMGLHPNLKANAKWYLVSLVIFPIGTATILAIGKITGWISFSNFGIQAFLQGFTGTLFFNFIKNIFEESVWRGYLAAKLIKLRTKDIWIYLIVGGVWGLWHLPYYLFFLSEQVMAPVLPVDRISFALWAVFSMVCWSVMFVELFRITGSLWPVVILHMIEDSLINHLIIDGHITISAGKEILVSPVAGIITSFLYLTVGLLLRKSRLFKTTT